MVISIPNEMSLLERICAECNPEGVECVEINAFKCCVFHLKALNPQATAEDIFNYCCITQCGFKKHKCLYCFIQKAGVIRFIPQMKEPSQLLITDAAQMKITDFGILASGGSP